MNPTEWTPPADWQRITTTDAHTEGEPFRVVTGSYPEIPGATILARRRYAKQHLDHLRTALTWEPRGHAELDCGNSTSRLREHARSQPSAPNPPLARWPESKFLC